MQTQILHAKPLFIFVVSRTMYAGEPNAWLGSRTMYAEEPAGEPTAWLGSAPTCKHPVCQQNIFIHELLCFYLGLVSKFIMPKKLGL